MSGMIQCAEDATIVAKAEEIETVAMDVEEMLSALLRGGVSTPGWDGATSIAVRCLSLIQGLAQEIAEQAEEQATPARPAIALAKPKRKAVAK